jgi:hypothetical protein
MIDTPVLRHMVINDGISKQLLLHYPVIREGRTVWVVRQELSDEEQNQLRTFLEAAQ